MVFAIIIEVLLLLVALRVLKHSREQIKSSATVVKGYLSYRNVTQRSNGKSTITSCLCIDQ